MREIVPLERLILELSFVAIPCPFFSLLKTFFLPIPPPLLQKTKHNTTSPKWPRINELWYEILSCLLLERKQNLYTFYLFGVSLYVAPFWDKTTITTTITVNSFRYSNSINLFDNVFASLSSLLEPVAPTSDRTIFFTFCICAIIEF